MNESERILLIKEEVFLFRLPSRKSDAGYRASDWKLIAPDRDCRIRIVEFNKELILKLEDKDSGELFAKCPIDSYPGLSIEPVLDSSRYFVIRLKDDNGRTAFVGMGFADRRDSFDVNVCIEDFFRLLQMNSTDIKPKISNETLRLNDSLKDEIIMKSNFQTKRSVDTAIRPFIKDEMIIESNIQTKCSDDTSIKASMARESEALGSIDLLAPLSPQDNQISNKKRFVTIKEKMEAIDKLEKGYSIYDLSYEYNVARTTIIGWKTNKNNLLEYQEEKKKWEGFRNRKSLKRPTYENVGEALYYWFIQEREKGIPMTGRMLQFRAREFNKLLNKGDCNFKASDGWFEKWKKFYGVRHLNLSGVKSSVHKIANKSDVHRRTIDKECKLNDSDMVQIVVQDGACDGNGNAFQTTTLHDPEKKIKHLDALVYIENCIIYLKQQKDVPTSLLTDLIKWRKYAEDESLNEL